MNYLYKGRPKQLSAYKRMRTHQHYLGKKVLMTFIILCSALSLQAQERTTLNVWFADGTTTAFLLYTRPLVTFEGDKVVISSPVAKFTYDAKEVLRFTYSKTGNAVKTPKDDASFKKDGEQIIFDATVKSSDIQLFTEDGKRLPASLSSVNDRSTLSLKNLPAGVYLLNVNGRTSKILKK